MRFLLLLPILTSSVSADWIDPDTPWEARTTRRYDATPPKHPPPPKNGTEKSNSTRKFHFPFPTIQPTSAPTLSAAPSQTPTTSPTSYPTFGDKTFELVFSDEFNTPYRNFRDGSDPRWTALEKNDYTNDALHYYSHDNAWTNEEGHLVIKSEAKDTDIVGFDDQKGENVHVTKHFKSAMLQTWNKFCFTGGIIEAEAILPGKHDVGGLWSAFWLLGNLGRHTYVASSMAVWPWSQTNCTKKSLDAQRLSACHQAVHYGLEQGIGRGAPEIDIFEVQAGDIKANTGPFLKSPVGQPFASCSFQVAPGKPNMRPGNGEWPGPGQWYDGLKWGKNTSLNILFYGNYNHLSKVKHVVKSDYWSDAISMNRQLDEDFFKNPHVFRVEWDVPTDDSPGYLHWFIDGKLVFALEGDVVEAPKTGAQISSEPSYILLNTAISKQWGFPISCPDNCDCKEYDCHSDDWQHTCGFSDGFCDMMKKEPPEYKVNWVRVYQDPSNPTQKVGCSTPERPTRRYIEAHASDYMTAQDDQPLKPIQRGQGRCNPNAVGVVPEACGGNQRGKCTRGSVCECLPGWTGPHCLAREGSDPIIWDGPDKITDVGFVPPSLFPMALMIGLGGLIIFLLLTLQFRHRLAGYTAISDAKL